MAETETISATFEEGLKLLDERTKPHRENLSSTITRDIMNICLAAGWTGSSGVREWLAIRLGVARPNGPPAPAPVPTLPGHKDAGFVDHAALDHGLDAMRLSAQTPPKPKRAYRMSKAGRARQIAASKKYWAKRRKAKKA